MEQTLNGRRHDKTLAWHPERRDIERDAVGGDHRGMGGAVTRGRKIAPHMIRAIRDAAIARLKYRTVPTRADLAREAGVSVAAVIQVERGITYRDDLAREECDTLKPHAPE